MSQRETFVIPVAPNKQQAAAGPATRRSADGIRLGILDNGKGNADHLLSMLVERLRAAVPVRSVVSLRKGSAAAGAPKEMLDRLGTQADFVLSAMAD
jgi:hypothetical protein